MNFDPSILRNPHLSASIKWYPATHAADHLPELEPLGDFQCPISGCTKRYGTASAVACHIRKSKLPDHGLIQPLSKLVVSSECPCCGSRFTNKWTTVQHLLRSAITGICTKQHRPYLDLRVEPQTLKCPMSDPNLITNNDQTTCDYIGSTLPDLQQHIARHHFLFAPTVRASKNDGARIAGTGGRPDTNVAQPVSSTQQRSGSQAHERSTTSPTTGTQGTAMQRRPTTRGVVERRRRSNTTADGHLPGRRRR